MSYASAVLIAPDLFITSGHYTPRNGSLTAKLHEIVFGANYHTSTERYSVSRTERYPGYVFGDTSTIDLGVGWTSNFVVGFSPVVLASSYSNFILLTVAEYGNYGDMTTGELPSLGDRMGGIARTGSAAGSSYLNGLYFATRFEGSGASDPLNVGMLDYSSGSGWWNENGELAGITIASSNTILGGGSNFVLNLSRPEIQSYLQPLIDDSWARYNASITPRPMLGCAVMTASVQLTFSNLIPAREYRLMRSSTLSAWEEAHRFTATSTTGSWSEALVPAGRRFYRLEWTE